ncbi:zinc finger-containing ubiquitin peptidase 1 isoform 2-T2 [Polymixia lowei]
MLTCEICGEVLVLEEDMKTHLLLSHLENEMSCPLCSLSGVSYDELSYHISTAHPENHDREQEPDCGSPVHFNSSSCSTTGTYSKHNRDLSDSSKLGTVHSHSPGDSCGLARGGVSFAMSHLTTSMVEPQQSSDVTSRCTTPVSGVSSPERKVPKITSSALTTRSLRTKESGRHSDDGNKDPGITSDHAKVKQKQLSSPIKERKFSCPMCSLVFSNCFILQEHVELHLQEQKSSEGAALGACTSAMVLPTSNCISGEKSYECPMCSAVCMDSFSLQEHVELHLDCGAATSCIESPGRDLKLARQLQQEEDHRRREQEAKQEAVEFKKLQKQFGLDGGGGYRKQMERTMERAVSRGLIAPADFHSKRAEMMESLASGLDDCRTRTQGMLGALYEYYQREARDCVHVWLSAETDHYCSSEGDKGWGCGYRNFQMLLSALHRMETFAHCFSEKAVPSIPQVQSMIEGAWKEGLDPQGASHFNQRLQGTRAWIGATEIYALLTFLGIGAHITDFHQPTGPGDTHPRLFEWVKQYFSQSPRSCRLPPRVIQTSQPPLYLQHQDARKLLHRDSSTIAVRHIRKFPSNLKRKQYQVVAVDGILSADEKQICILNSRTLQAERIP